MGKSKDLATGASYVDTSGDTMTGVLTGTSAGFTGDVNIGNNDASNPVSKLRLGATLYGAADIVPVSTGHKIGLDFKTDSTGDTTIDPVTRMSISNEGYITTPFQPSFSAYRDAGQVTSGNVYVFDHTNYNIGNMYDTSNGRATVPVDGRYFLGVWIMTENDATYNNKYFRIRINNANPAYKNVYSSNGGSVHHQFSWAGVIDLTANDYVDIYIDGFTAYGSNFLYSNFSMHLLS